MKRILFIDDEKDMFPVVTKLFPKDSYRVVCASDGAEGMMKCRNEEFDLIITDFRMPKVDGFKFFQQIRDIEEIKKRDQTPILFVSAWADEIKAKKRDWPKCDFLTKPFQMYELTQKAQKLLGEQVSAASHGETKPEGRILLTAGQTLFDEGDSGLTMYYVLSGELTTYKKTSQGELKMVGKIYPGELIGEMGVIDGSARAMKVVAEESCELISIPAEKITGLIEAQPKWIKLMLENLVKRLRSSLKQIA